MTAGDLSECAREPIHRPGSIQPHGVLLGADRESFEILVESANAAEFLGVPGSLRGRNLADVIDASTLAFLRSKLAGDVRDANPLELTLPSGQSAHGVVHESAGLLILELEQGDTSAPRLAAAYRRLLRRFDGLRRAADVQDVCDLAVAEIRELTGFDRVMIYRFEPNNNGQVIAENCVTGLEEFLGLHFPESDIPAQARALYIENPLRLIADADYQPVPLLPPENPLTGEPLDLSHASLRSVSPIHCEYLANMGVRASMSISLVLGERLWGLVACHHREPRKLDYGTRLVSEFLAHVLSARIYELDRVESLTAKARSYAIQTRLIEQMVAGSRFQEGLAEGVHTLADLLPCDGAAVIVDEQVTCVGLTPSEDQLLRISAELNSQPVHRATFTARLNELLPWTSEIAEDVSGMIAVPISTERRDMLFWFRAEERREVTWAGNPHKAAEASEPGARLSPRRSFEAWTEVTRNQSKPWLEWQIEVASDFRTALVASVVHQAAQLQRLNVQLVEAGQQKDRFLATVSHELRNPLNAIVGWVRVAQMGLPPDQLKKALATIERNAQSQAVLIDDLLDVSRIEGGRLQLEPKPCDLRQVIERALESLEPVARANQISIETDYRIERADIIGDPGRLQQVVWNLLSNAIKFSDGQSRVSVRLSRRHSMVTIEVEDEGQGIEPQLAKVLFEPFRQGDGPRRSAGLGLGLSIVKSIVELHGGEVSMESAGLGHGSTFTVALPVAAIQVPESPEVELPVEASSVDLSDVEVLVVEDQADSAEMIARLLTLAGARAIQASDGAVALAQLREKAFDAVVSDLDMPVMDGYELMREIRADESLRAIPVVALTAYSQRGDRARALQAGFRQHVSKPVDAGELLAVIGSLLARI